MRQRLSPHSVGITAMLVLAALVAGLLTGVQDSRAQDTPPLVPLAVSAPIRFSYQPERDPGNPGQRRGRLHRRQLRV